MHYHAIHVRSVAYVSSKKSQDPGSRKWSDWATLQASEAWKWSKRFGTSYLSLSFILHKGWGCNLSSNKKCGTSLLQGENSKSWQSSFHHGCMTLNTFSVKLLHKNFSQLRCHDFPPFVWPYGDMSHPRLPTIHRSHWGASSTMTASKPMNIRSSNWIWKTSDLITRADTGQPGNGEQCQRVSKTLISTASSQCSTISSQKDHNVIMCHCSYFVPLNIQGTSTRHCTQFMLCSWIVSARPKFVVLHISPGSKSICLEDTLKESCFHRHTRRKMIEAIWYLYSCY